MFTQQHAITVDLEDWFHVCAAADAAALSCESRVVPATSAVLELLQRQRVRATFFVLGSVAAQHPALIERIAEAGHELASHGWSHRLVFELQPDQFADELQRTADLVERLSGQRPTGFRAPRWSLCRRRTPWAFEILMQQGYRYDSSLTPLALIGDPDGPRGPHLIEVGQSRLWELPPLVTATPFGNLPTGGGWGFRFFPQRLISTTLQQYGQAGLPGVLFIHPRECDPQGPRLALGPLREFVTYGPRSSAAGRLERLLTSFSFTTLGDLVRSWQPAS